MVWSESRQEIVKAISSVQQEMEHAQKTSDNPIFNSQYADLAEVMRVLKGPLGKTGLCVVSSPDVNYNELVDKTVVKKNVQKNPYKVDYTSFKITVPAVTVKTMVLHNSGESLTATLTLTPGEDTPQAIGSCVTYARRYTLMSIFGIAPVDDDGNAASETRNQPKETATDNAFGGPVVENDPYWLTPQQKKNINALIEKKLSGNLDAFLTWSKEKYGEKIPYRKYSDVIKTINESPQEIMSHARKAD